MLVTTRDSWRGLLSAAILLIMFSAGSIGADIQSFDLDGGNAEQTLKQFARQARLSIVFDPQGVEGVQTQEVVGLFLPEDALERMLTGTPLVFKQDLETGAFAVMRPELPVPQLTTHSSEPQPMKETEMIVKKNNLLRTIATVLTLGAVGAPGLSAQDRQGDEAQVFDLPEYSVYAQAAESAVEAQRESDIIGSYLGSDSLADLPDDDLGEALSRLAGINVIGGAGDDVASVTIRGADGQYNTIRINGALQANAQLGSRNYDLNQIPTEMVASVEVLKSITAEYPADSIGGAVNVTTASAFTLLQPVSRYKLEYRLRDINDENGFGANYVYADTYSVGKGEKNLGLFLNFNYIDESLIVWGTQNRFLSSANRLNDDDPSFESFANQTILDVNPDAMHPIWDRFDPDERRIDRDEFTFNASIDYKLGTATNLYFRPWIQSTNYERNLFASRLDRIERAFANDNWFFLDENMNPLGTWEDADEDGILGSAGDTFNQAVDSSGNLVITNAYEANFDGRNYRQAQNTVRDSFTYTLDLGGETSFDNGILDYRVLYSVDDSDSLVSEWRFQEEHNDARGGNLPLRTRFTDGSTPLPEFIVFEVTQKRGHVPANNYENVFGDPSRIFSNGNLYTNDDVHEDVLLGEVNYQHQFNENFTLKTGLRYRKAARENTTKQLFFTPSAGGRRVFPVTEMVNMDTDTGGELTLFDGKYADTHGPFLLAKPIFNFFLSDLAANPDNWAFDRGDLRDAADTADLEEEISAAYIQGTYRWNDFSVVAGVRYEKTNVDSTWRPSNFIVSTAGIPGLSDEDKANIDALITDKLADLGYTGNPTTFSFGDIVDDINRKNDYDNFLPSVVASWRVRDTGHIFRLAWTNTLTRPDYRELIPFDLGEANKQLQSVGLLNLTSRTDEYDIGNPNLTEQTSENWDFAWEYYFGPEQRNTFSVTFFRKDLEDFLQEDVFSREIELLIDPDDPSQGTEMVRSDSFFWSNAAEATIDGVEVSGYFNFGTLFPDSGFLHYFSFIPNYTYITGDQRNPIFDEDELENGNFVVIDYEETDSLTNQAEHILNLQLFFETRRWNVRLSYNYISELQRTPSTAAISARTFDTEQERIDLSIQYRLFRDSDTRLFLEADNLTNQPQDERFIGQRAGLYTTSYEETGRRYVFGIRGSF